MNKNIFLVANSSWYMHNFRISTIQNFVAKNYSVYCLVPDREFEDELVAAGAQLRIYPMQSASTNIFSEILVLISLFMIFIKKKPDIVFTFTPKPNIYCGLICIFLRINFVPNISGFGVAIKHKNKFLRFVVINLYIYICKKSHSVFVQNQHDYIFLKSRIHKNFKSIEKLPGSGVDIARFDHMPLPVSEPFVFGMFARLIEEKGLRKVIDAARILRAKQLPQFEILVAGSTAFERSNGICKSELDGWIEEGVIKYLGNLKDVRSSLSRCHCVLLPTSYPEGTPKSLIEAASMGRLIITSDQPGCGDVVAENSGFVLKNNSAEDLASAMEKILYLEPVQLSKASIEARRHVVTNFDETLVIQHYNRILEA